MKARKIQRPVPARDRAEIPRPRINNHPPLVVFFFPTTHNNLVPVELRAMQQMTWKIALLLCSIWDGALDSGRIMRPRPRRLRLSHHAPNSAEVAQVVRRRRRTRTFPPFFTCCESYRTSPRSLLQPTSMDAGGWGGFDSYLLVLTSFALPRCGFEPRPLRKNCGKASQKC